MTRLTPTEQEIMFALERQPLTLQGIIGRIHTDQDHLRKRVARLMYLDLVQSDAVSPENSASPLFSLTEAGRAWCDEKRRFGI